MTDHLQAFREIEYRVAAWAGTRDDVRVVIVIGSRARKDIVADALSDLDLVVYADQPQSLLDDPGWLDAIGPVKLTFVERPGIGGWRVRRAVFDPALDVEFAIVAASLLDIDFSISGPVADIVRPVVDRGYRVLHDPAGHLAQMERVSVSPATAWTLPSRPVFTNFATEFWYNASQVGRLRRRGDPGAARNILDGVMKDHIVQGINWLAHLGVPNAGTRDGRKLFDGWTDREIGESFHAGGSDTPGTGMSADLNRSMDLFSAVGGAVAERLGYAWPDAVEGHVRELIRAGMARPESGAHEPAGDR